MPPHAVAWCTASLTHKAVCCHQHESLVVAVHVYSECTVSVNLSKSTVSMTIAACRYAHFSDISLKMVPQAPSLLERYTNNPENMRPPKNPTVPPGGLGWHTAEVSHWGGACKCVVHVMCEGLCLMCVVHAACHVCHRLCPQLSLGHPVAGQACPDGCICSILNEEIDSRGPAVAVHKSFNKHFWCGLLVYSV